MIFSAKAKIIAAAGAGIVFLTMLTTIGWLWNSRDTLQQEVGGLEQSIDQLTQSATEREAENADLRAEIDRRDALVAKAIRNRQQADEDARQAQSRLQEALAHDECAHTDHPGAVTDSLRRNRSGDSDQNRVPKSSDRPNRAHPGT